MTPTVHEPTQEIVVDRCNGGWRIRLPLRAEHVSVEKRLFVIEEVEVRRELLEEIEPVTETVRREEPRVRTNGDVDATQQLPTQRREPVHD